MYFTPRIEENLRAIEEIILEINLQKSREGDIQTWRARKGTKNVTWERTDYRISWLTVHRTRGLLFYANCTPKQAENYFGLWSFSLQDISLRRWISPETLFEEQAKERFTTGLEAHKRYDTILKTEHS